MTNSDKAKRATVAIGSSEVDAFQMPDGSYCMSQAQVAECIGTTPQNAGSSGIPVVPPRCSGGYVKPNFSYPSRSRVSRWNIVSTFKMP
jgi:hypothetical protein